MIERLEVAASRLKAERAHGGEPPEPGAPTPPGHPPAPGPESAGGVQDALDGLAEAGVEVRRARARLDDLSARLGRG